MGRQDVGEELHRPIADRHTAIDPQPVDREPRIARHRRGEVARLIADRLEHRARDLWQPAIGGQAAQHPARVRRPVRRAEPAKGRDEIHALARIGPRRYRLRLGRGLDRAEPVAQPLDGGAGDEDAAFERVGGLAAKLVRDRRQQAVTRGGRLRAGMQERERAGAIGRFDHAGAKAGLPDQRRLLVAGHRGDRDRIAKQFGQGCAEITAGRVHLRQQPSRDAERVAQFRIPSKTVQIEQHRAGGIRDIRRVQFAAGEAPQEKAVDRAERDLAFGGALTQPRHLVEHPADLRCREIRIDHEPGALRDRVPETGSTPFLAKRRGAAVLPNDRIVHGATARPVPQHRGLALVRDTDGGDGSIRSNNRFAAGRDDAGPDLLRIVLDPARLRIMLRQLDMGRVVHPARRVEQDRAGAGRALIDRQEVICRSHRPSFINAAERGGSPGRLRQQIATNTGWSG